MVVAVAQHDVRRLPLAPKNPLPYRQQLGAVRDFIDGFQRLRDAGGPVTRIVLGPKWLFPTAVLIATPQGARDVLGRSDEIADRGGATSMVQMRPRSVEIDSLEQDFPLETPFTVVAATPIRARVRTRTSSNRT